MKPEDKPFEMEKTFGLSVLFKLTQRNCRYLTILEDGNKFIFNVTLSEMQKAVDATLKTYHICLSIQ